MWNLIKRILGIKPPQPPRFPVKHSLKSYPNIHIELKKYKGVIIGSSPYVPKVLKGDYLILESNNKEELFKVKKLKIKEKKGHYEWRLVVQWVYSVSCPVCKTLYEADQNLVECPRCKVDL